MRYYFSLLLVCALGLSACVSGSTRIPDPVVYHVNQPPAYVTPEVIERAWKRAHEMVPGTDAFLESEDMLVSVYWHWNDPMFCGEFEFNSCVLRSGSYTKTFRIELDVTLHYRFVGGIEELLAHEFGHALLFLVGVSNENGRHERMLAPLRLRAEIPLEDDPMSYKRVFSLADEVEEAIAFEAEFPLEVALALMVVESGGDVHARRRATKKRTNPVSKKVYRIKTFAQYCGAWQMGDYAGRDVGFKKKPVYWTDPEGHRHVIGSDTCAHLLGDLETSALALVRYMQRYSDRHAWDPDTMALLWKAGPGTLKTAQARMDAGDSFDKAVLYAQKKHNIPRADEYVRRFRKAYARVSHEEAKARWNQTKNGLLTAGEALISPFTRLAHGVKNWIS